MVRAYTVALVGFAHNEVATFESFFRLAARRPPRYLVQDEVLDAQILIVNADNTQALHLVRYAELPGKVLLLGHSDGGTGWPLQRKPVKLVSVLAALDAIVGHSRTAAARPAPARKPPRTDFALTQHLPMDGRLPSLARLTGRRKAVESFFSSTLPMQRSETTPGASPALAPGALAAARRPGVMRLTEWGTLDDWPVPAMAPVSSRSGRSSRAPRARTVAPAFAPDVPRADWLLVAQSLVEGRILHKRFKRYGLSIDWARESAQALAMLEAHPYRLVVIDRLQGEPDVYHLCRQAKQRKLASGQPPVVIMFAPTAGSMDRIKAGLAGSDAYLSRSVGEAELYNVLAQHRLVNLDGFEKTRMGGL